MKTVTDLRSRDQWMVSFNEAAPLYPRLNKFDIALGNRIALHHNVKDCRCDPGHATLAMEMNRSERSIRRSIAKLKQEGWIKDKRGGRADNVAFELVMYADRLPAKPDFIPANMLANMESGNGAVHTGQNSHPYRTESNSIADTQCGQTEENRGREQRREHSASLRSAGAPAARPAEMPSVLHWSEAQIVRYCVNERGVSQDIAVKVVQQMIGEGHLVMADPVRGLFDVTGLVNRMS